MKTLIGPILFAAMFAAFPAAAAAQGNEGEAVMVAAATWARDRLPGGELRIDPHRTGRGVGDAAAAGVARALGADLGTLEQTRRCTDLMRPETCQLDADVLLAIAAPSLDGGNARVKVYAWYRQSSPGQPVGKSTWDLRLRRTASGWAVVSGGR